jgi:hypothetical protein
MIKLVLSRFVLASSLALALPLLAGCGSKMPEETEPAASGTVSLPLTASSNGHTYRLSNAYVYISGPQYSTVLVSTSNPDENVLSTSLPTGNYTAYLYNWTLEREDGHGAFVPIQASLASSTAVGFSIFNGTSSTVSYQFSTDGVIVVVGSGTLNVAVTVDEHAAVCTPFADDCAAGTWCPPTGLTGGPRACMTAGAIALGDPCSSPSECVANSSCFDLGSGPKCTELCPLGAVGSACSAGGTCEDSGPDYGVCRPTPLE